jgi:hypothetical protein
MNLVNIPKLYFDTLASTVTYTMSFWLTFFRNLYYSPYLIRAMFLSFFLICENCESFSLCSWIYNTNEQNKKAYKNQTPNQWEHTCEGSQPGRRKRKVTRNEEGVLFSNKHISVWTTICNIMEIYWLTYSEVRRFHKVKSCLEMAK